MQLEEEEEGLGTGDQILVVIFFVFLRIFNPKNRKKGVINYEINEQWHIRREVRKVNVPMILLLSCSLEERHPPTRKSWDGDVDVSMEAVKRAAIQAGAFGCTISGAGPTAVAVIDDEQTGHLIAKHMIDAFLHVGNLKASANVKQLDRLGARRIPNWTFSSLSLWYASLLYRLCLYFYFPKAMILPNLHFSPTEIHTTTKAFSISNLLSLLLLF